MIFDQKSTQINFGRGKKISWFFWKIKIFCLKIDPKKILAREHFSMSFSKNHDFFTKNRSKKILARQKIFMVFSKKQDFWHIF